MAEINDKELLVSIRCITYNHVHFLRQCLDGFVMQKTNFRFEAIVHDDASTDGTTEILREYAEKYPDIIKPMYEIENQYSKGNGILRDKVNAQLIGKYIALCEGDDYWTDPYKLQKQVDFLESHSDYSMCFHNAILHFEDKVLSGADECLQDKEFSNIEDKDYSGKEIFEKWIIPTASVIYRRSVINTTFYKDATMNPNFMYGDIVLFLSCARMGKIRGLSEVMSVYRRHEGGVTQILSEQKRSNDLKRIAHTEEIPLVFGKEYEWSSMKIVESIVSDFEMNQDFFKYYIAFLKKNPFFIFYALLRHTKKYIQRKIHHVQ